MFSYFLQLFFSLLLRRLVLINGRLTFCLNLNYRSLFASVKIKHGKPIQLLGPFISENLRRGHLRLFILIFERIVLKLLWPDFGLLSSFYLIILGWNKSAHRLQTCKCFKSWLIKLHSGAVHCVFDFLISYFLKFRIYRLLPLILILTCKTHWVIISILTIELAEWHVNWLLIAIAIAITITITIRISVGVVGDVIGVHSLMELIF